MKAKVPDYIAYPILFAIVGTFLFIIPFFGPLLFIPLIPLSELYDRIIPGNFSETGEHVDIGFAWISFLTTQAWLFYISFFFWIGLIVGTLKHRIANRSKFIGTAVVVLIAIPMVISYFAYAYENKLSLINLTTATDAVYSCNEQSSLELYQNGEVWRFEEDGRFRDWTLLGVVDKENKTFTWREFNFVKTEDNTNRIAQYETDLRSCRNVHGVTILGVYKETSPQNILKEN